MATTLIRNSSTNHHTATSSTVKNSAATLTEGNSTVKKDLQSYDDIREKIRQRNLSKKTAKTSAPKDYDYAHWEDRKRVKDNDYPFYSHDELATLAQVPLEIAALFPTNFSNTTLLSPPPQQSYSFKKSKDIFTNKGIDIFELLSRWNNTEFPFYSKSDRLRVEMKTPPVPRYIYLMTHTIVT